MQGNTNSQIRSFLEVVRCESFSKAAMRLFISQSAVSKNISALENRVGFLLIDRSENKVRPTLIGELFYHFYEEQEQKYKELLEQAQEMVKNQTGEIRLGGLNGWNISSIYQGLEDSLLKDHPEIGLSFNGFDYPVILEALAEKQIDIALMLDIFIPKNDKFYSKEIAGAPVVMVCSSRHPCADKKNLCLADFKDEPFYVVSSDEQHDNPMSQLILSMCGKYGFVPRIQYEPGYVSIYMQLQRGRGVWITSGWVGIDQSSMYRTTQLEKELHVCAVWMDKEKNGLKHIVVNEMLRIENNNKKDDTE